MPFEGVDLRHDAIVDASLRIGVADDGERVDADVEACFDGAAVHVVDGALAQLWDADLKIADLDVGAFPKPEGEQPGRDTDDRCRRAWPGNPGDASPKAVQLLGPSVDALPVAIHGTQVGKEHRQHHQIRERDSGDPEARDDGHLLNHGDRDQNNGEKTDRVAGKRGAAGDEQATEASPCRGHAVMTKENFRAHGADHLHGMTHGDGKDEKGHEYRHGIDCEPEQRGGAELPGDGDQRAYQGNGREKHGLRIGVDEQGSDEQTDAEEKHDPARPVRNLPHGLGEADNVHFITRVVGVPGPDGLLEPVGDVDVVETLARARIELEQARADDGATEIVGNEASDDSRLEDIRSDVVQALGVG